MTNLHKVVVAVDSYKESLSSLKAVNAIISGFRSVYPDTEYIGIPVADGGEGTVESIVSSLGGEYRYLTTCLPNFAKSQTRYGLIDSGNTAVIEVAASAGLGQLAPAERSASSTTSYGVGEQILDALEHKSDNRVSKIIIGLGGSATNDCGVGIMSALGVRFLDSDGHQVKPIGSELIKIDSVDVSRLHPSLHETEFIIASDVNNPLYGPNGAAYVFAPQKGADSDQVKELDLGLQSLAAKISTATGKDVSQIAGAGAAGGIGAGLMAFIPNIKIMKGIDLVAEVCNLETHINGADLVITGEGAIDSQTIFGKVPVGISKIAVNHSVPVIAIVGSILDGHESVYEHGISSIFSIMEKPCELTQAIEQGEELLTRTANRIARLLKNV